MTKGNSDYELSAEADQDISEIFDYTHDEFGLAQAKAYITEMESIFFVLADNPESGRMRDEIREGLFSLPYQSHVIFYRILSAKIRIVRILHGSRDFLALL